MKRKTEVATGHSVNFFKVYTKHISVTITFNRISADSQSSTDELLTCIDRDTEDNTKRNQCWVCDCNTKIHQDVESWKRTDNKRQSCNQCAQ